MPFVTTWLQVHALCEGGPCQNGAECRVHSNGEEDFYCQCPLGFQGKTCDTRIDVETPHFQGESFLQLELEEGDSVRHSTELQLQLRADEADGLLLWIGAGALHASDTTVLRDRPDLR
jgi:hypothetical protein